MLKALATIWMCVQYAACAVVLGTILMSQFRSHGPSDVTAPSVSSVTASAGTYYFVGRTLTLTATFDEEVTVTGTPRIALTIGSNTRYATYTGGSGTTTLTFTYTFVAGDSATSGFTATSPIDLNSGTIKDAANNNATLTFSAPSMASKRAILRGVTVATDFETPANPDLPNKIDGTTLSADVGVQGSTINSDTNDPTWVAGTGARFDGNDFFSSVPYAGGLASYIDTTMVFSMHFRGKAPAVPIVPWSSANQSGTILGSWTYVTSSWVYFYNTNNAGSTYRIAPSTDPCDGSNHTISLVGNGNNGTIKVYIDGVLQGSTITAKTTDAQTDLTEPKIGYAPNGYAYSGANVYKRALCICNVEQTDAEVAAAHTYLSTLPNAA